MTEFAPPFSKSADNNKDHILAELRTCLKPGDQVLEVASGTAQHALHFSQHMPDICWQCSDRDFSSFGLDQILARHPRANLPAPMIVDIAEWPDLGHQFDVVYSANCLHIIADSLIAPYVIGAARSLKSGGAMLLYGPFKYGGDFTTQSNADFDRFLRETYAGGGIKDIELLGQLAKEQGMYLEKDISMPANNQFLIWRKA